MHLDSTVRNNRELWLTVFGYFGHGDDNVRAGRAIERALRDAIDDQESEIREVIIDFTNAEAIGGDGPLWAVGPAIRRRLKIRFIASGTNYRCLSDLLRLTRMDQVICLDRCED